MKINDAAQLFAALSHPGRLMVFRTLMDALKSPGGGLSAGELAAVVRMAPSTLSFHLKDLRLAGLADSRRYGRQVVYSANQSAVDVLISFLGNLHGEAEVDPHEPYNVLFLCTGNSARSLMAESILRHVGQGRFRAFSAGASPRPQAHPLTLETLSKARYPIDDLSPKGWDRFGDDDSPEMDFVFTVCDAAAEVCPTWPGQPLVTHWSIPDPASAEGSDAVKALAFADAFRMLFNRITIFVNLPLEALDRLALQRRLNGIGMLGSLEPNGQVYARQDAM
jgi:arsenate reductase